MAALLTSPISFDIFPATVELWLTFLLICAILSEIFVILTAICEVVADCCSTAVAIPATMSFTSFIKVDMVLIASTVRPVVP